MNTPSQQQIEGVIRWVLAAGSPFAGFIVSKWGQDTLTQVTSMALYVVPPLVALIWSLVRKTQASIANQAATIPGVTVKVNTATASQSVADSAMANIVNDPNKPQVQ